SLPIGPNLFSGLTHIHNLPSQQHKLAALWVDAVCINRIDDAEKDHRIKMTHAIHGGTETVVIWLG
ncbi:hypothetical protein QBC39DRAFT_242518, partial [Podospora conica]